MHKLRAFFFRFPFYVLVSSSIGLTNLQGAEDNRWESYYQNSLNIVEPRETLSKALEFFRKENRTEGKAIDLGAGTGRDTLYLLKEGWNVLAIDQESHSIDILLNRADQEEQRRLEVIIAAFSDMVLPEKVDLINASYSLPFCEPASFSECWEKIVNSLAVGGRFCGQLFGNRDEWSHKSKMTFHTVEEMLDLFADRFEIEDLQIQEGIGPGRDGSTKYWHVYHIVAKKIK